MGQLHIYVITGYLHTSLILSVTPAGAQWRPIQLGLILILFFLFFFCGGSRTRTMALGQPCKFLVAVCTNPRNELKDVRLFLRFGTACRNWMTRMPRFWLSSQISPLSFQVKICINIPVHSLTQIISVILSTYYINTFLENLGPWVFLAMILALLCMCINRFTFGIWSNWPV
jgi:hypothetical protein